MTSHNNDEKIDHVWKLIEKIGVAVLATRDGEEIRGRPMAAHAARDEDAIYFLTDVDGHKDDEVERDPHVALFFADPGSNNYVAVTGRAAVSNDRAKIKELWSTPAKAWWDNPDDPRIRVLRITPNDAQYWDGPGKIVTAFKMMAAAMSEGRPRLGDNEKLSHL